LENPSVTYRVKIVLRLNADINPKMDNRYKTYIYPKGKEIDELFDLDDMEFILNNRIMIRRIMAKMTLEK